MGLYDPVLTSIGLLESGKLSKKARDKYFEEVTGLLVNGNAGGHGMPNVITAILPIPPVDPIPPIMNVTTLKYEKVFWFSPDPFAATQAAQISVRANAEILHAIFIDLLYEKTAVALDVKGSTPFAPILDYSVIFGDDFPFPPKFPDDFKAKLPDLGIKLPELTVPILMAKLGIKFPPPVPPFNLPIPPLPPSLPKIDLPIPPLALLDLCIGLIKLPFTALQSLILPPKIDLALNIPDLPASVFKLVFGLLIDLLKELNLLLIVPKLLVACLLVYVKNIVGMLVTDIIGMLVGSGNLARSGAKLCGLI